MIREAKFVDIPGICTLMLEGHAVSKYKEYPINVDRKLKPLIMESIRSGNHCVFVSTIDERITGFLIGMVDDLYHILNVKYATDLFFYVADVDRKGGVGLLNEFIQWARQVPNVVRIRLGVTNVAEGVDYDRVAKLYVQKGFIQEGLLFEMEVTP